MGKTSFQNHEIGAISTDTERNRQTMDERMENRKGRRQKVSQYTQKTTHRNRNQTLSKHQKSKTYSMYSETRMGHCSLNKYLHRFHITDDSTCECGEGEETVEHYLLRCEKYDRQRDRLRRKVGIEGMRTEKLLGDLKLIQHTIKYIEETERFN